MTVRVRKEFRVNKLRQLSSYGTHVAGSIAGAPFATASPKFRNVKGTAPAAQLVVQSIWSSSGGLVVPSGENLRKMLLEPLQKYDAHIHSNSWADAWSGSQVNYTSDSAKVDQCVLDNPSLLVCMAAGNSGNQTEGGTVGSIAACKNVLTIGATDSTRPSQEGKLLMNNASENDPTQISHFSARGPTLEQRIKPDVLAPGTTILSTLSQLLRRSETGVVLNKEFEASEDPNYGYSTGTSMATPLVAGCAAVLREYLIKIGVADPPAALLKALLINGSFALHHAHAGREGFGLVNIANSLVPQNGPEGGLHIGKSFDNINQSESVKVPIPAVQAQQQGQGGVPETRPSIQRVTPPSRGVVTLKVTLVYNDAPGEKLQNNLNLQVRSSNDRTRNGNRGSSKWFDNYNNVEQVIWKGIAAGEATLTVLCNYLTSKTQDYVLVWRIIPSDD